MPSTTLQMRRQRIRRIRRRVVGIATAIFLASTGGIFIQLVSGHDPALATSTNHATTTTASVATGSSSSGSSSTSVSDTSGSATAVTTHAS